MIINHNMNAANAHRNMAANNVTSGRSMEKLSSGLRINRAGDDAAGLAISEKMRGQIRGLDQASRNAQDGISMIQTAEGALNETHSILQRMRELSNQSANGTNTEIDRKSIQDEMNQLTSEVNRIGNTTEFNTQKLLNGGIGSNTGAKVTQATSAKVTLDGPVGNAAVAADITIKVDGRTFNVGGVKAPTADEAGALESAKQLGDITSGGVKLSELVDIKTDGAGKLVFTAKSSGANSKIEFNKDDANLGVKASTDKAVGNPTTIESAGIEATNGLDAADTTLAAGASLSITVGNESAVVVKLNEGTAPKLYKTATGIDDNEKKAAMTNLIKDMNAAIQKAGLSDKVEAALSKDNKVQIMSKTGIDVSLDTVAPAPGAATVTALGGGLDAVKNVERVVGPGTQGSGFNTTFQIGANKGQSMTLSVNDMRAAALGITGNAGQLGFTKENAVTDGTTDVKQEASLNVMTKEDASRSIETLDKAIATVSSERGKLGSLQNRLEHTIANLGTSSENLQSAESRIRDVDMAKEMLNFSKNNILSQASQAMLAQAKQQPEAVLQLLR